MTSKTPGEMRISPVNPKQESRKAEEDEADKGTGSIGEEKGAEDEVEADEPEEAKVREVRDPGCPTVEERERHNKTHVPARPWCPVCVEAKGIEDPHYKAGKDREYEMPLISIDYKSFGQSAPGEGEKGTALIIKDRDTKVIYAHLVEEKGVGDEWIVKRLIDDIESLGYTDVIIKGDGEPAIVQVMKEVQRKRTPKTVIENPPAYDPKSNGAAEKAVDHFMGQMRAIKIGLERRIKRRVETTWPILTWMAEHSCMMLNRYQVGKDGKTPHRRATGKECVQKTLEFGEQVYAKPKRRPSTNRKQALETRWKIGTWVGMTNRSNEHIVVVQDKDAEYAIRVRTVRRVSEDQRWNADAIQRITATVKVPIPAQKHRGEPLVAEASEARNFAEVGGDGTNLADAEVEQKGQDIQRLQDHQENTG